MIDDAVSEGAAGTRFVEIRGQAERVSVAPPATAGVNRQIIGIHPRRVISRNADPDHPGLQTRDVAGNTGEPGPIRPPFGTDAGAARRENQAVADFVAELQAGPAGHPLEPACDVTGAFPEMALSVLVRHDRTWWVAAGQNTVIRPGPPESQEHVDGARDG